MASTSITEYVKKKNHPCIITVLPIIDRRYLSLNEIDFADISIKENEKMFGSYGYFIFVFNIVKKKIVFFDHTVILKPFVRDFESEKQLSYSEFMGKYSNRYRSPVVEFFSKDIEYPEIRHIIIVESALDMATSIRRFLIYTQSLFTVSFTTIWNARNLLIPFENFMRQQLRNIGISQHEKAFRYTGLIQYSRFFAKDWQDLPTRVLRELRDQYDDPEYGEIDIPDDDTFYRTMFYF